jgi:hypothetical protein
LATEAGVIEAVHPSPDGPWIFSRAALSTLTARATTEQARQNPKCLRLFIITKLNAAGSGWRSGGAIPDRRFRIQYCPGERQTPEALGALQKAEAEKWWPIIKELGIKVE